MAVRELTMSIEESVLSDAEVILEDMGLDVQTAVKMFLKKVIRERRMPFELSAGQQPASAADTHIANFPETVSREIVINRRVIRPTNKITGDMCIALWKEFKRRYSSGDRNIQDAAHAVSDETGMNRGSAFIYLTIINNLADGVQNTRTLKYEDLEFFVDRIRAEFPQAVLKSVIESLEASIPYWEEKVPGSFADKARALAERLYGLLEE